MNVATNVAGKFVSHTLKQEKREREYLNLEYHHGNSFACHFQKIYWISFQSEKGTPFSTAFAKLEVNSDFM